MPRMRAATSTRTPWLAPLAANSGSASGHAILSKNETAARGIDMVVPLRVLAVGEEALFAYLVLYRSSDLSRPPDKRMLVMLTGTLALYGSMMLSQAMERVTRVFYGRGDLDLILSSPVAVWRLFAVRIGAIVVTIAVMSLALAAPFINILAWFSGLRWLAAYGVIVALAMVTVAVAVMLTVGLFRTIGPKHTRLCAQIVAAVIGASFVISMQLAAILSYGSPSRFAFLQSEAVTRYAPDSGSSLWLPARAILGDMCALVVVFSISAIMISMDGKGRCMDNIFVERLWRSLKYEEVYLNAYGSVAEAKAGIGAWLSFYNDERQHQSLGYRTPRRVYEEGLWICGRSALPTGCASPASRASSEGGEMLAFAHIPTGAAANQGLNIDKVNSRLLEPAIALTAIGADTETGRATP